MKLSSKCRDFEANVPEPKIGPQSSVRLIVVSENGYVTTSLHLVCKYSLTFNRRFIKSLQKQTLVNPSLQGLILVYKVKDC